MTTPEQHERNRREQFEAIADGINANLVHIEQKVEFWRSSMMSAFTVLAQRDVADEKERKARQSKLDHELRLLRWGVGVALFLLVVLVSLFVGYRLR